jgi:hypothetical protein
VTGGKPIAVLLQSISGVSAVNPLVAFYDIHERKREVLFFNFVPDTTQDNLIIVIQCISGRNKNVIIHFNFVCIIHTYTHITAHSLAR